MRGLYAMDELLLSVGTETDVIIQLLLLLKEKSYRLITWTMIVQVCQPITALLPQILLQQDCIKDSHTHQPWLLYIIIINVYYQTI